MPTYEYVCRECGQHLEVVQSFSDDPLDTCERCGGALRKVFSAAGIIFKGSGYYVTDSRAARTKAAASASGADGSSSTDTSESTDTASSDSSSSDASGTDGGSSDSSSSTSTGSSSSDAKSA